mmetsp:Transcript_11475/g.19299  ORF Transcript_11475/g.19299 Transcript_11475/m.19299 type:complete len:759 (-) Transcript_11475:81-2357(-)|eukprot:CAMPEP_0119343616 /NCGR_PEP_ID=MMETSP1333-20130426/106543_1 /TAXON_ID=418940 /ORGANISM="Scyphosphaera apsteinii, Strain RCC1455" /LENGTH=758 /DNA_ID=CAMNT_0007356019 /DNA_START=103 /DNA_END=2379 /DNA_ORIENTATION=-
MASSALSTDTLNFSPQLEAALQELSPSTDPLDSPCFDPIAHINRLFPSEESLSNVDTYAADLEKQMVTLDEEVLQTVRQQTSAGSNARKDLESGKAAMAELFQKVREIKGKAERSEQMVHEICRDIKSLDYAKRHLTLTITALKRLQMLVTAAEQLSVMTRERMYVDAANLLQAVNQLLSHFEGYSGIPKVDDLREQISEIRTTLRTQVFEDFNQLSSREGTPQPSQLDTMTGACAVVDALGPDVRKEMVSWFSNWQFAPYKHNFQPYDGEAGSLEKTELRYAWHRQLLKQYDELFTQLFPPSWQVALTITRDFCAITHKHLDETLDQSRGALDVSVLTHALQKTAEFEKEMDNRFSNGSTDAAVASSDVNTNGTSPSSSGLLGSISNCFDKYIPIYVSLEDKSIEEALSKLVADETWTASLGARADLRVFDSSKELFIALRRSFKRSTALHMSSVLFELHKVWAKQLRAYAKKVDAKLPTLGQPTDPSLPPPCVLDADGMQRVCAVVNTAKYCSETTSQLEESILKAIDTEYSERIDLSLVKEEFQRVVTSGMRVLVAYLENKISPALSAMSRMKWEAMDDLSDDTSPYMIELVTMAREMLPMLGEALSALYVRFFCDKFVESFVPRLIGSIYRCKGIGEVGAQQMQVDVGTLKETLLALPALGQASPTGYYTKLVSNEMAKAEQVLKLVQTPEEMLEVTVEEMRGSGIGIDLQKILELKGVKKADSERLLEAYKLMTASASEGGKKIKNIFNLNIS